MSGSVFDLISDRPDIIIKHNTPTPVTFDENEPATTGKDRYGAPRYEFYVNGDKSLGISSKPFMRALKPFAPLAGKTLVITKTGHGYDTVYTVEAVNLDD